MFIEIEKMVDLDSINPVEIIGEPWHVFGESIPKEQYNVLSGVLKLLYAIDDTMNELTPLIIGTLINEGLGIQSKKLEIYLTLNNVLNEQLEAAGIHLHEEYKGFEYLPLHTYLFAVLFEIGGLEDVYGLSDKLLNTEIDSVSRFEQLLQVFYTEEELEDVIYHVHDVSERLLTSVAGTLKNDDTLLEGVSDATIERIKANMLFMDDTLGRQIVTNGSALEGDIGTFKTFFKNELETLRLDTSEEGLKKYVFNVVSLYLVSNINTPTLLVKLAEEFAELSDDILQAMNIESYLKLLVLDV
ncbi:hypothetical protein [Shewanella phage FishSpeaker]|nr:hypothetical protein [Shewanella phage FishSpeaker]